MELPFQRDVPGRAWGLDNVIEVGTTALDMIHRKIMRIHSPQGGYPAAKYVIFDV